MVTRKKIGRYMFKIDAVFSTKKEAEDHIRNARDYGEQVRLQKVARGYIVWGRIGDYPID
jgi:hypothetical protein